MGGERKAWKRVIMGEGDGGKRIECQCRGAESSKKKDHSNTPSAVTATATLDHCQLIIRRSP